MLSHIRFLEGYIYYCFPGGPVVKNPPASAGDAKDLGSIPVSGSSPGVGNGNPLQYSCLGTSTDRGTWWAPVHGIAVRHDWATELILYFTWASQVALMVKNPPTNSGDGRGMGLIPGLGQSPGRGHGNPLQYSCLGNPMDRGTWWAPVHGL